MSNEPESVSLEVSVKKRFFMYGRLCKSFVTVAAGVDVDSFLLEIKESLLSLLLVL